MREILLYKAIKHRPTKDSDYIIVDKTIVDDGDFDIFNKYRWFLHNDYVYYSTSSICSFLHREIMNCPKDKMIDHINHDTLDNRKSNLRIVTNSQNQYNQKIRCGLSSKFKGVTRYALRNAWRATIRFKTKKIHIGYFKDEIEAAKAYNKAALKYFGKYATLNKL